MIDKTNYKLIEDIKRRYNQEVVDKKYKVWKEAYLAQAPKRAFCTGMTRYRKVFKITHVKLEDGTWVSVSTNTIGCLVFIVVVIVPWVMLFTLN